MRLSAGSMIISTTLLWLSTWFPFLPIHDILARPARRMEFGLLLA